MFTGIVEEMGTVRRISRGRHSAVLEIEADVVMGDLKQGDSVAVNGVCLTATALYRHGFAADVMHETIERTSLLSLKMGSRVNLERAMAANGRFGGHIVAGHVDGVGRIVQISRDDTAIWYTIQAEPSVMRYIIEKGSVAIEGISLTVARVETDRFSVSVIPHTQRMTVLKERREGDMVNLENDLVGKYIEKLCGLKPETERNPQKSGGGVTMELLNRCGF